MSGRDVDKNTGSFQFITKVTDTVCVNVLVGVQT
ncbi:Uncharacterised protein [Vibrio cholerae]|nr:Uncharacterised protein [Vibrio cholerae]